MKLAATFIAVLFSATALSAGMTAGRPVTPENTALNTGSGFDASMPVFNKSSAAPGLPAPTAVETTTKGYAPDRGGNDASMDLVRSFLAKAVGSDFVKADPALLTSYSSMLSALDKSSVKISNVTCKGRFESYVAYVTGGKNSLKVFVCNRFDYLPAGSKAQTIVHELSHLVLNTSELEATRLETIATYLGGRTPELNGYNSDELMTDIVGLDDSTLRDRTFDYFILMNARTPEKFYKLKLKTYAIYKHQKGVAYVINKLCGEDAACRRKLVTEKDEFGMSVEDNLAESKVDSPQAFINTALSARK